MTEQDVLERILELTARHLGYETEGVAARQTFIGLGADSLQLIGMLKQLEGEFGVRLAIRDVLEDAGTPELTARLIISRRNGDAPGAVPAPAAPPATVTQAPAAPAVAEMPADAPVAAAGVTAAADQYAHRSDIAELTRQIDVLAETQAAMLVQLSEAIALLGAERVR